MRKYWKFLLISAGTLLASATAHAGEPTTTAPAMPASNAAPTPPAGGNNQSASSGKATASSETTIPSSTGDIKKGDTIEFPVETAIYYRIDPKTMKKGGPFCAASHHDFTVDDIGEKMGNDADLTVHFNDGFWNRLFGRERTGFACTRKANADISSVERLQSYQVSSKDISSAGPRRLGLAWGALVIPYKYEFKDGSFSGTPSTVAFLGVQDSINDITITYTVVAGPGVSGSASTNSGNKALWTVGGGVVGTFAKVFKVGMMFGYDMAGRGSGFKYEGTPWLALSIGAGF